MAYNQMLQSTLEGVKNIARTDLFLFDTECKIVAATGNLDDHHMTSVQSFIQSPAEIQVVSGFQYFKVFNSGGLEYVMLIKGDTDDFYTIGKLVAFQIHNLLSAYKEKYDKENFIKSVLLNNILQMDINPKAAKLRINPEAERVVMLVEVDRDRDHTAREIIKGLFTGSNKDFIVSIDENMIVLVKEVGQDETKEDLEELAYSIVDLLNTEAMTNAKVAIGTGVNLLKDIADSYNEAKMALDVGKIFYEGRSVIAFDSLGIGRLIYQLPLSLCKVFMNEVFPDSALDEIDEETLTTIVRFFENSLNISETARQLFIHRNTLVYRLEKVNKATGLDLRVFEDAIIFQIALMVSKYMNYMEEKEL